MPNLMEQVHHTQESAVNILRQSKRENLRKVSEQSSKQFWKTVKLLKKASSQIPTLKMDSNVASSNTAKAIVCL